MLAAQEGPAGLEQRLRRACADLERRLLAGEECRSEEYLAELPGLGSEDGLLDLLYTEQQARGVAARRAIYEDLARRFPSSAEGLRRQAELEEWLGGAEASPAAQCEGYEVLAEVGRGGMGVVYKARHRGLGRVVALKMIVADADEAALGRLQREAEAVARLQHPHIVQIFEAGAREGRAFLALEYVEGSTLERKVAGTPQPPREVAKLIEVVARAIHHSHENGIIHRDLKPANILLTAGGAPKVADFGLAKLLGEEGPTRSEQVLGTPAYMAPEQAAGGGAVGPAADVYALGAILYECLTGSPPFKGPTPLDTLQQVQSREPVSPRVLQPGVPRDLETVCLKCLEKEPERRYGSAQALADDLGRFLDGRPVVARAVGLGTRAWRLARRRPIPAGLLVALVAALTGGAAGVVWEWREAVRERRRAEAFFDYANQAMFRMSSLSFGPELRDPEKLPEARRLIRVTALEYYQTLLQLRHVKEQSGRRAERALAKERVAYFLFHLSRKEEALGAYREATALWEDVCREEPDGRFGYHFSNKQSQEVTTIQPGVGPPYRSALAGCHVKMAVLLTEVGKLAEGARHAERARELHRSLDPLGPIARRHTGQMAESLAALHVKGRRPRHALELYEEAVESYGHLPVEVLRSNPRLAEQIFQRCQRFVARAKFTGEEDRARCAELLRRAERLAESSRR